MEVKPLLMGRVTRVELIGCGGTGSILAEHLARMITGFRLPVALRLWDGDTVEPANVARQNFQPHEVGQNKAHVLALRLAGQFGIPVAAETRHCGGMLLMDAAHESARHGMVGRNTDPDWTVAGNVGRTVLVITAVDSLLARRRIGEALPERRLWLDVGNERHTGQAILGTTAAPALLGAAWRDWDRHPYVAELPDIFALNAKLRKATGREAKTPSCADQPFAQQGCGVNAMAALAAAMIARAALVDGRVQTAQVWFDVAAGRALPVAVTRSLLEPWQGATGQAAGASKKKGTKRDR